MTAIVYLMPRSRARQVCHFHLIYAWTILIPPSLCPHFDHPAPCCWPISIARYYTYELSDSVLISRFWRLHAMLRQALRRLHILRVPYQDLAQSPVVLAVLPFLGFGQLDVHI